MTLSLSLQNKAGINICINISVYIGLYTRQNSFNILITELLILQEFKTYTIVTKHNYLLLGCSHCS